MNIHSFKLPKNWGRPNPVFNYVTGKYDSGGIIWIGKNPATDEDKWALKVVFGNKVKIDVPSTRGTLDPKYSTLDMRSKKKAAYKQKVTTK